MWSVRVVTRVIIAVYLITSIVGFRVPTPRIQVFQSGGVKMSIPDVDGIQKVDFHVNVNKYIGHREGQYTKYLLRPVNGVWIYDNSALYLTIGDVLYYWIFIKFNNFGYKRLGESFTVYEFSSMDETTSTEVSYITPPPTVAGTTPSPTTTSAAASNQCNIFVQNVTQSIFHLENQMNVLREENSILRDLASGDNLRLNLTGLITLTGEPLEIVRFVLDEKLDVEARVVKSAWRTANATVTFEVYSLDNKVAIIRGANDKLKQSTQIKITYK